MHALAKQAGGNALLPRAQRAILPAVGRFGYLTALQLARLLFTASGISHVREHCRKLRQAGYLERLYRLPLEPRGAYLPVYTLTSTGFNWLKAEGLAPEGRFKAPEQREKSQYFLRHTLSANDMLILAHLLSRSHPQVVLEELRTERELKHEAAPFEVAGYAYKVVPDGWIDLRVSKTQFCIAFEVDRNTVSRKDWFEKIKIWGCYLDGPYEEAFATKSKTVAVVIAVGGEKRAQELISWTGDELQRLGRTDQSGYFLFSAFDPATADPHSAFLEPIWNQPFDPTPLPLLE